MRVSRVTGAIMFDSLDHIETVAEQYWVWITLIVAKCFHTMFLSLKRCSIELGRNFLLKVLRSVTGRFGFLVDTISQVTPIYLQSAEFDS